MDKHRGFTLVELVIVNLVVGILAAITSPKLLDVSDAAKDNGLRQTLAVVRRAIENFKANNEGALPGASDGIASTFKSDLAPYLRGPFPKGPVGPVEGDNRVRIINNGNPMSGHPTPARAWKYDYTTGQFIFNFNGISSDGVTSYDDF